MAAFLQSILLERCRAACKATNNLVYSNRRLIAVQPPPHMSFGSQQSHTAGSWGECRNVAACLGIREVDRRGQLWLKCCVVRGLSLASIPLLFYFLRSTLCETNIVQSETIRHSGGWENLGIKEDIPSMCTLTYTCTCIYD